MKCLNCNYENPEGNKFCNACGSSLTEPQPTNFTNQEVPYQNIQPNYNVQLNNTIETPEDKEKANRLCTIALILEFGLPLFSGLLAAMAAQLGGDYVSYAVTPFAGISSLGGIAAFAIMIYVRIKYPKNTFGKVLMWIYIVQLIISVIAVIGLILLFISCMQSC